MESGKFLQVESGILDFGIGDSAQGIRNPANGVPLTMITECTEWNLGFKTLLPLNGAKCKKKLHKCQLAKKPYRSFHLRVQRH